MRLLSVVGIKTSSGRRTTIVNSHSYSLQRRNTRSYLKFGKSLIALALSSLFLLLLAKENPLAKVMQSKVMSLTEPVSRAVAKPFLWIENVFSYFTSQELLLEQNQQLKLQNDYLLRLQQSNQQHIDENHKLREALNVKNIVLDEITTARITHHTFDGFSSQYYLSATLFDGVSKNDAVLTTSGALLGRVIDVSEDYVRLMTILDASSNVPVQFESTHEQAMVSGNGSKTLDVLRVENPGAVRPGDRLITSGVGGVYPAGIPVAVVKSVENGKIKAAPHATAKDLDFVLIVTSQLFH